MTDKEKVITGLEELSGFLFKEYGKAQAKEANLYYDRFLTVDNAITLLKEEAVKPTWNRGRPFCGACGLRIRGGKFCSECGKPILWEGQRWNGSSWI